MRERRKQIRERLRRRAQQEREGEARHQDVATRKGRVMAAFERRRELFVALLVAMLFLPVLFGFIPKEVQGSSVFLGIAVLVGWGGAIVVRYMVWRCPNCNRALPLSTQFGPFVKQRENCPHCGARLE